MLYDDLDQRPGAKFATADLIGIPWQILVGPKGLAEGKVELKKRADGSRQLLSPADADSWLVAAVRRRQTDSVGKLDVSGLLPRPRSRANK